ncbi:17249_t:CDS:10, partial [Funneliformis geosporum]
MTLREPHIKSFVPPQIIGWEEYTLIKTVIREIPLSNQAYVLQISGMTPYGTLMTVGKPKAGETIYISWLGSPALTGKAGVRFPDAEVCFNVFSYNLVTYATCSLCHDVFRKIFSIFYSEYFPIRNFNVKFEELTVAGFKEALSEKSRITEMNVWKLLDKNDMQIQDAPTLESLIVDHGERIPFDRFPELYPIPNIARHFYKRDNVDMRLNVKITDTVRELINNLKMKPKFAICFCMWIVDYRQILVIGIMSQQLIVILHSLLQSIGSAFRHYNDSINNTAREEAKRLIILEFTARSSISIFSKRNSQILHLVTISYPSSMVNNEVKLSGQKTLIFAIDESNVASNKLFSDYFHNINKHPCGLLMPMIEILRLFEISTVITVTAFTLKQGKIDKSNGSPCNENNKCRKSVTRKQTIVLKYAVNKTVQSIKNDIICHLEVIVNEAYEKEDLENTRLKKFWQVKEPLAIEPVKIVLHFQYKSPTEPLIKKHLQQTVDYDDNSNTSKGIMWHLMKDNVDIIKKILSTPTPLEIVAKMYFNKLSGKDVEDDKKSTNWSHMYREKDAQERTPNQSKQSNRGGSNTEDNDVIMYINEKLYFPT